jgi:hypothetical protein
MLTLKQVMPFSVSENMNGVVAYDPTTAETLAILVAQEWTFTSCYVHQVILKTFVIRHGWFEEVANWMFTEANRLQVYALVPSNNDKALSLNGKLGFKEKAVLEQAYDRDIDFVLMELKAEDCPYWTAREEQKVA